MGKGELNELTADLAEASWSALESYETSRCVWLAGDRINECLTRVRPRQPDGRVKRTADGEGRAFDTRRLPERALPQRDVESAVTRRYARRRLDPAGVKRVSRVLGDVNEQNVGVIRRMDQAPDPPDERARGRTRRPVIQCARRRTPCHRDDHDEDLDHRAPAAAATSHRAAPIFDVHTVDARGPATGSVSGASRDRAE